MRRINLVVLALVAIYLLAAPLASGQDEKSGKKEAAKIVTEAYQIPSKDQGIQLYVRNKRPEGMTKFSPDHILLFIHGATWPSEATFDLPVGGFSWMDYIAQHGWDVYLTDVRGYGRSTRPPEMSQPPNANAPIVNTDVAISDLATVVDHILARRSVSRITLMGWSWGTVIAGAYTAQNNAKVERLVLYAPVWLRQSPSTPGLAIRVEGPMGAYRSVTVEAVRQRWFQGGPTEKQQDLIPDGWFDAWWKALLESDPVGAAQSPPVLHAPNGVLEDIQKYWLSDTRYYDPSKITVPTLLVQAEWDNDTPPYMAQGVFARLTNAPLKRYVVIGEGTHTVLLERNRIQLFREVQLFLDEPH
jgi:pimeloyl-ACP methyl ester carboxylesterase